MKNKTKFTLLIDSVKWATRCWAKGLITKRDALGHIKATWIIIRGVA
jgi:hypothetical protein